MKYFLIIAFGLFSKVDTNAQIDSIQNKSWIINKISFGRSQHIQYLGNNDTYKTNTLLNKAYYAFFSPIKYKGFNPFISLNYEYFITQANCYTCIDANLNQHKEKQFHFINFGSIGLGFNQEIVFKTKKGKDVEFILGASMERYLFKRSIIFQQNGAINKTRPFISSSKFFNQYFFKDLYGVRVYHSNNYKVFIQLSGVLLRNERLNYEPSRHTFHNFMLGFVIILK